MLLEMVVLVMITTRMILILVMVVVVTMTMTMKMTIMINDDDNDDTGWLPRRIFVPCVRRRQQRGSQLLRVCTGARCNCLSLFVAVCLYRCLLSLFVCTGGPCSDDQNLDYVLVNGDGYKQN